MKKLLLILIIFCASASFVMGQGMKIMLNHKAYATDKIQPYIEFTFRVGGNTVAYALNEDKRYQAEVLINVDVIRDDQVVKNLRYILVSETFTDTVVEGRPDFGDVQNLPVDNGDYYLSFSFKDLHGDTTTLTYVDYISVHFPKDSVCTSGIDLLSDVRAAEPGDLYAKYGLSMTPLFYNFAGENLYNLPFVMEVYNTERFFGKGKKFLAKCYIEFLENHKLATPQSIQTLEVKTAPVALVFGRFNIYQLPSGNYNLVTEIMDEDSLVYCLNRCFFQRSNPGMSLQLENYDDVVVENTFVSAITDKKQMEDYVASLYPIATRMERDFFDRRMKKVSFEMLQKFFYSFWLTRNPNDPESEWLAYQQKVDFVQKAFGSKLVKGYRTDRGRVYLQYGPPNDIKDAPFDPSAYPYQVWHYYHLQDQNNVKFVFWCPAEVTNDYELLHSDKVDEPHYPSWQMMLVKRLHQQENYQITKPEDYFGNEMENYWKFND